MIGGVRRIPFRVVKIHQSGRLGILDTEREAVAAANHIHIERADGEVRGILVVVRIHGDQLFFCRSAGDQQPGREIATHGRQQLHGVVFQVQHAEVRRAVRRQMNFIVCRGAKGIIAYRQPIEAGQRKPARRFLQVAGMLRAPGG